MRRGAEEGSSLAGNGGAGYERMGRTEESEELSLVVSPRPFSSYLSQLSPHGHGKSCKGNVREFWGDGVGVRVIISLSGRDFSINSLGEESVCVLRN